MIIRHANEWLETPQKASQFTGLALGDVVMPTADGVTINTVTFAPGARTHWHEHEQGQVLHVVAGYGLICSEGGPVERMRAGDTIWIPPGERHWHGASPATFLTHLAISLGPTLWSDEVAEHEYAEPTEGDADRG